MNLKFYIAITILLFGLNARSRPAVKDNFQVSVVGKLPSADSVQTNPGIAGAFSGIVQGRLFIAGGANFPEALPWEGGRKVYHDRITVFRLNGNELGLVDRSFRLKNPRAYGASVSLPEGVLCIGGSDQSACYSNVFLLRWNDLQQNIDFEDYPDLPVPLSFMSAALLGNAVYVIGGSASPDGTDTGNHFFRLDLLKKGTEKFEWEKLPDFPGSGRVFPVSAVQSNGTRPCIYLFSGRHVDESKEITVLKDGMFYDPVINGWTSIGDEAQQEFPVMAATAFPLGAGSIVFPGGDPGELLLKEQQFKRQLNHAINEGNTEAVSRIQAELVSHLENHPGFSKNILLYNTITNTVTVGGQFSFFCPVTTNAIPCGNGVILTSGEIKPGIRTPDIIQVTPIQQSFQFGWLNSAVILLYFLLLVVIGYIFSKKQKNTDDYFKGGGRVPWWAAGLSLFGTALSAITFMAVPAKTYATDWAYFAFNMSIFLVAPVIIILFIPFYRSLNVTTAYEYLEKRFSLTIRLLGSISFILFQIGRMGVVLLLPSLALNVVTGMDVFWCIVLMGIISLIYTMMGGIEAVIWTDVIQVVVLLTGALIAIFLMTNAIDGGIGTVYETAVSANKFNLLDLRLTLREPTVWVMLIGGLFTNITTYGTDQTMVQRYLTTKTEKEARRSVWTNAWLTIPATILFFSIGTSLFVFYKNFPELNNPMLENADAVFPWYIASELPDGFSGLLIAGIFAAAMSSLSSSMNSAATAYSTDIHFRFKLTSKISPLKIARATTFVIGLAGTLFALFMATWNIQSLWDEFNKLIGLLIGSLGGLFLLGILTRSANTPGALIGIAVSIFVQVFVSNHHFVHLLMYTATGVISCFVAGWLGSLFFPGSKKPVDGLTVTSDQ
ncbi:sodium:solute symporter family transporter [Gaoshiqia sp. Z1-71]|uniref:sodium:solute symporter family transporter n=1 Tax=Gaoshiqia hydrogeniformans TaxID=3290090 RepID=UPI003BF81B65